MTQPGGRRQSEGNKKEAQMSKQDFVAIAKAIAAQMAHGDKHTLALVARDIADHCKRRNPNFDRYRFLAACSVED